MQFLTDFADQGVVLPLAVAFGLAFFFAGWRRAALAWAFAVPATLIVVLAAKMLIAACGPFALLHGLRSPSGHTASAAVVYGGGLALLLPAPSVPNARLKRAAVLAALLAALIGGTRLALHLHSRTDVLVGGMTGVAGALALAYLAGPRPARLRVAMPLAVMLALGLLLHGEHLRAEDRIDRLSRHLWPLTLFCPRPDAS